MATSLAEASSRVSPEFDITSATSCSVIMPRSPWLASAGWTKKAGVPVDARVAAVLWATWPDLPIPEQTTRPAIEPPGEGKAEALALVGAGENSAEVLLLFDSASDGGRHSPFCVLLPVVRPQQLRPYEIGLL